MLLLVMDMDIGKSRRRGGEESGKGQRTPQHRKDNDELLHVIAPLKFASVSIPILSRYAES